MPWIISSTNLHAQACSTTSSILSSTNLCNTLQWVSLNVIVALVQVHFVRNSRVALASRECIWSALDLVTAQARAPFVHLEQILPSSGVRAYIPSTCTYLTLPQPIWAWKVAWRCSTKALEECRAGRCKFHMRNHTLLTQWWIIALALQNLHSLCKEKLLSPLL